MPVYAVQPGFSLCYLIVPPRGPLGFSRNHATQAQGYVVADDAKAFSMGGPCAFPTDPTFYPDAEWRPADRFGHSQPAVATSPKRKGLFRIAFGLSEMP